MSESITPQKPPADTAKQEAPRVRGIGNPDSHSQDADRHHGVRHTVPKK